MSSIQTLQVTGDLSRRNVVEVVSSPAGELNSSFGNGGRGMWRLAILRSLIAFTWTVAGLSSAQVVYGHPHIWRVSCLDVVAQEMIAEGVQSPNDEAHRGEWYRRGDEIRIRFSVQERLGYYGWLFAMCAGAATAVGLMVVFPGLQAALQKQADIGNSSEDQDNAT